MVHGIVIVRPVTDSKKNWCMGDNSLYPFHMKNNGRIKLVHRNAQK